MTLATTFTRTTALLFAPLLLCAQLPCDVRAQAWEIVARNVIANPMQDGGAMIYKDGVLWAGLNELRKSTDMGMTWMDVAMPPPTSGLPTIRDIDFIDRDTGVMAIESEGVYYTDNGGNTWIQVADGIPSTSARFVGHSSHIVASVQSELITTTDRGMSWRTIGVVGWTTMLLGQKDGTVNFLGAVNGPMNFYQSEDYGISWKFVQTIVDNDSYSFARDSCEQDRFIAVNEDVYFSTDNVSQLCLTTDAGRTWRVTFTDGLLDVAGSIAVSASAAYVQTRLNGILRSLDRGETWQNVGGPNTHVDSRYITAVDDNTVYTISDQGHLWRTTNSGGTPISEEVPLSRADLFAGVLKASCEGSILDSVDIRLRCSALTVVRQRIVGSDSSAYRIARPAESLLNGAGSVVIEFTAPDSAGTDASYELVLSNGAVLKLPLLAQTKVTGRAEMISFEGGATDTMGGTVEAKLLVRVERSAPRARFDVEYDSSYMRYIETIGPEGAFSPSSAYLNGSQTVEIVPSADRSRIDTFVVRFTVFGGPTPCSSVTAKNFTSLDATFCGLLSDTTHVTQICGPSGCGVETLHDFLLYDRAPVITIAYNPVRDRLMLNGDAVGDVTLSVVDRTGRGVISSPAHFNGHDQVQLPIGSIADGAYFLVVRGPNVFKQLAFIKE